MKLNKLQYEYIPNGILGFKPEIEIKKLAKENLELITTNNLKKFNQNDYTFSYSWYSTAKTQQMDTLKNIMVASIIKNKANSNNLFWTTFKDSKTRLQGSQFTKPPKNGLP